MIAHGCPSVVRMCDCKPTSLCTDGASRRSVGNGRLASNVRPSIYYCPRLRLLSALSHVSLRSLYETVHPILFPVSVRSASDRAHRSRPMMKWPARKGKGSESLSHTQSALALSLCLPYQAEQSRQIQTSYGIWIISKRGRAVAFVMDAADADGRRARPALVCPITEGRGSALFAICPFDLHM